MSDFGELGPLDVQLTKDDELTHTSGLSYLQSLLFIKKQTFDFFEEFFTQLKAHSDYTITTKTAGEISASLAVGLLSPISEQFDPLRLGEVQRALNIASLYGNRICRLNRSCIPTLIATYPTHGFVIDYEEAVNVLKLSNVRLIKGHEEEFEKLFRARVRMEGETPLIGILYPSPSPGVKPKAKTISKKPKQKTGTSPNKLESNNGKTAQTQTNGKR